MPKLSVKQAEQRLIKYALSFPETTLEHPWGHDVVKVKGKMFASFGGGGRNARRILDECEVAGVCRNGADALVGRADRLWPRQSPGGSRRG